MENARSFLRKFPMNRRLDHQNCWLKNAGWIVAVGVLYYYISQFGLQFSYEKSHESPVWPPAGLALAALLLLGWRVWPGIWLGAFAADITLFIQGQGASPFTALWVSAAIATGDTLEALAGWWLWRRWFGDSRSDREDYFFEGLNVFRLAAMALLICFPSAFIDPWAICTAGFSQWSQFPLIWAISWIGDSSSILLFTPFVIAWAQPVRLRWNPARAIEGIAAFGTLALSIALVFSWWNSVRPISYLPIVPMVWIAVRQSPRAVASALVFLAASAICFTVHQKGPFSGTSIHESLLFLLIFLWVVAITCMMLAGSVTAKKKLARQLEERVEAKTGEARRHQEHLRLFMENMPGAAFIKNLAGKYVYANEQTRHLGGRELTDWIGSNDYERLPRDVADVCVTNDCRVLKSRQPLRVLETIPLKDGPHEWLMHKFLLFDAQGRAEAVAGLAIDITDLKRAEERIQNALEKEIILRREINHRVKNNLQVICSLLYLQSTKNEDPVMGQLLHEIQARVQSLSLIYDMLSQQGEVTGIPFADYVHELARKVFTTYRVAPEKITLKISIEPVFLDLDTALPCGLILTELVCNALKYAFPENRKGEVMIEMRPLSGGFCSLAVCDNGIGLPGDFDVENATSLGLRLVRDLAQQLKGRLDFHNEKGTTARITFPSPPGFPCPPEIARI